MIARTNPHRLIELRWFIALIEVVIIFGASLVTPVPVAELLGVVGVLLGSNVALFVAARRGFKIGEWVVSGVLAFDLVLLTFGLHLSGGPMNPFSFLYVVYVAMAAVATRGFIPWVIMSMAIGGYGLLYFFNPVDHAHQHGNMELHLEGMWMAMAATALMIVAFVRLLQRALTEREEELRDIRARQEREDRLAAMTTMAAGAAHQLTTPLSTIAIVAKELERSLEGEAAEDARIIREQVTRCTEVLHTLSRDAGRSVGESSEAVSLRDAIDVAVGRVGEPVTVEADADLFVMAPRLSLQEVLTALIQNGIDAGGEVTVVLEANESAVIRVIDTGEGMSPEVIAHAPDPFYSTKEDQDRMGLGLFVAHRLVGVLGGGIEIESNDTGTTVTLTLPIFRRA